MLKLSKRADYGLLALGYMGRGGDRSWHRVEEIARHHRIPAEQLCKVMQNLSGAGIVEPKVGRHGGYRLARGLKKISLAEVVGAIEGPLGIAKCLVDPAFRCEQEQACDLPDSLRQVQRRLLHVLEDVSVAEATGVAV